MSFMIAAALLSCGLTAAPDGTPAPEGSIAMINAPIPDELVRSLATRIAPAPTMRFVGETTPTPEWIIGFKRESETKFRIARLTYGMLTYDIRIGWVEVQNDGTNIFTETSKGTCQIKETSAGLQGEAQ